MCTGYLGVSESFRGVVGVEVASLGVPGRDSVPHVRLVALQVPVFEQHQVLSSVLSVTEDNVLCFQDSSKSVRYKTMSYSSLMVRFNVRGRFNMFVKI